MPVERDPGHSEPFVTRVPATEENLRAMLDTFGGGGTPWRIALAALFMRAGKYMPKIAKRRGAYIGLCNAEGYRVEDKATATHIGFTAGDDEEMEALPTPEIPEVPR